MPSFYSELFDTVRNARHESVMASAVLRMQMLGQQPVKLSLNHAIDAPFIVDDCSTDPAFRVLVRKRRIQFKPYPTLRNPIELLCSRMENADAVLSTWDADVATWAQESKHKGTFAEARKLVAARIRENGSVGYDAIDGRIDRVRILAEKIDQAGEVDPEPKRAGWMSERVESAYELLPDDEPHRPARTLLQALGTLPQRDERSALYGEIRRRTGDPRTALLCRDIVDAIYNQTVAKSLGSPLHSARRILSGVTKDYHVAAASPCNIGVLDIPEDLLEGARDSELTWNHVSQFQLQLLGEDVDRDVYENAIVTLNAIRGPVEASALPNLAAGVISILCGGSVVQASGALAGAVLGLISLILSATFAQQTAGALREAESARFKYICHGWLDVLDPQ